MAIRPILQLGNPLLREVCAEVKFERHNAILENGDIHILVQDLRDTVRHSRQISGYGRAIAAPQIGELKRVVFLSEPKELVLINPQIIEHSVELEEVWDACLSFLCIFMKVPRYRWIKVRYSDLQGETHELIANTRDDLAELLQHEIDHLDGILALDRVTDLRSICTREEFETRHSLNTPYKSRKCEKQGLIKETNNLGVNGGI